MNPKQRTEAAYLIGLCVGALAAITAWMIYAWLGNDNVGVFFIVFGVMVLLNFAGKNLLLPYVFKDLDE